MPRFLLSELSEGCDAPTLAFEDGPAEELFIFNLF